jgi:hypothetical protein
MVLIARSPLRGLRQRRDLAEDLRGELVFGDLKIVAGLDVEPHFSGGPEESSKAESGFRRDRTLAIDDGSEAIARDTHEEGGSVGREPGVVEDSAEGFAGMDGGELFSAHEELLMIVRDFHFVGVVVTPFKTDSILVVDPDAVLASAVSK